MPAMPCRSELSLPTRYLGSLLPVLAVSVGVLILLGLQCILGPIAPELERFEAEPLLWSTDEFSLDDRYELIASGLWWVFSAYVFWLTASICSGVCLWIIYRSLDQYRTEIRWLALGVIVVIILFLGLFLLLGLRLSYIDTLIAASDLLVGVEKVAPGTRRLMELTNGYAILTIVLIILSSCIVLLPRPEGSVPGKSFHNLNMLLYSGGLLILFWLMYARIMYSFCGTLLIQDQQEVVGQIAPTIALIAGALSSIYLAIVYLSGLGWLQILYRHSGAGAAIVGESGEKEERAPSPFNRLLGNWPRIVAVLGPVLPGIADVFLDFDKLI